MAAVTPLNNVRQFERSSQQLRDITCRSFVGIPWPSTLYCVTRGVFSSTKHIGMEYIKVTFMCALFVVPSYNARVNGSSYCFCLTGNGHLRTDRVPLDAIRRSHVMPLCDIFCKSKHNHLTLSTLYATDYSCWWKWLLYESAQISTDIDILYPSFIRQLWCVRKCTCH